MDDTTTPRNGSLTVHLVHPDTDGEPVAFTWCSDGRVTALRPTGTAAGIEAVIDDAGEVQVHDCDGDGTRGAVRRARSVESRRNAYGVTVETHGYGTGIEVQRRFDDDDRLRQVELRSPLGVHRVTLWPDGSRAHDWQVAAQEGRGSRDSAGRLRDEASSLPTLPSA